MKALVISNQPLRLVATKLLSLITPKAFVGVTSPMQMQEIPEPQLPAEDWVIADTQICGLCGSDYKQVFMNGQIDNPMTSMISWPQVLGHEVVGIVSKVGAKVKNRKVGERVLLNPWLSCVTRGVEPCEYCKQGRLAQCLSFGRGYVERGIHHGNSATATGGFAQKVPAHESQWFSIPDGISNEAAVLADPFSVSFHAILKAPPPPNGTALVYGCGTLGLLAIAILRALYPTVKVFAVARYEHQAKLAEQFGAHKIFKHKPTKAIVDGIAKDLGCELNMPWMGLPMINGGLDCVYDTVSSAETMEVSIRILKTGGALLVIGVEPSRRFEWTPVYFKELRILGSNGFGIEEYQGKRQHGMEWYFDFIKQGKINVTPIITHQYAMHDYKTAFMTCFTQGEHGAVKVLFNNFG